MMKSLFKILLLGLALTSCGPSKTDRYTSIINQTTRIKIEYLKFDEVIELDKSQTEVFKAILKRNVEPENQRKFQADIRVELYDNNEQIGVLTITDNGSTAFVNFDSEDLHFGFLLTYGIGQYLEERNQKSGTSIQLQQF